MRGEELGLTRFFVASQVTALAPFSQNWNVEVCSLSGQAQPGQSKPSGLLVRKQREGGFAGVHLLADRLGRRLQGAPAACRGVVALNSGNLALTSHCIVSVYKLESGPIGALPTIRRTKFLNTAMHT